MIDLKQKELNEWQKKNFTDDEEIKRINQIDTIIRKYWFTSLPAASKEIYNLFKDEIHTYRQILGMFEEGGELAHWYLKGQQGIRGVTPEKAKEMMADSFADSTAFGTQVMSSIGVNAEKAIEETFESVLKRDWKNNPDGKGYSKHKE